MSIRRQEASHCNLGPGDLNLQCRHGRVDGERRDCQREHPVSRINLHSALNYNSNFTIATSVDDGVAAPITGRKTMTGITVNDAPTATNLNAAETYTEDTPLDLTDIVVSDVDSANVTATLHVVRLSQRAPSHRHLGLGNLDLQRGDRRVDASGAIADVNTLLAGLTFTPALDFNGNFTIATSVSDGVAPAITGTKTMTGLAVNNAPTATNLSAIRDLHRRYPAQSHRYRRERCR